LYGKNSFHTPPNDSINFDPTSRYRSVDKLKKRNINTQNNDGCKMILYTSLAMALIGLLCVDSNGDVRSEFNSLVSNYIEYNISDELKDYLIEQMEQVKKALINKNISVQEDILFPLSLLKIFNLYSVFKSMKDENISDFIFELNTNDHSKNKISFYLSSESNQFCTKFKSKTDKLNSNIKFEKNWYNPNNVYNADSFFTLIDNRFWTNFKSSKFTEELLKLLKNFTFKFSIKNYENKFSFSSKNHENSFCLDTDLPL